MVDCLNLKLEIGRFWLLKTLRGSLGGNDGGNCVRPVRLIAVKFAPGRPVNKASRRENLRDIDGVKYDSVGKIPGRLIRYFTFRSETTATHGVCTISVVWSSYLEN